MKRGNLLADAALIALSAFSIAWALSFWYKTNWVRERLGVYFVLDESGEPMDRDDGGGLGGWLNCPQCSVAIGVFVACLLWWLWDTALVFLSALGMGLLLIRWYESSRIKARWWQ